jgi:hypothetical protein
VDNFVRHLDCFNRCRPRDLSGARDRRLPVHGNHRRIVFSGMTVSNVFSESTSRCLPADRVALPSPPLHFRGETLAADTNEAVDLEVQGVSRVRSTADHRDDVVVWTAGDLRSKLARRRSNCRPSRFGGFYLVDWRLGKLRRSINQSGGTRRDALRCSAARSL